MTSAVNARGGFTLLELLVAITLLAILAGMSGWGGAAVLRDWQVSRAAYQLEEDLKTAQRQAEQLGDVTLSNGTQSFALSLTRAGVFTVCRWNGARWEK